MRPAAAALLLLLASASFADDAPLTLSGGAASILTPGGTKVRMAAETVIVALGTDLYSVDADFEFVNAGPSTTVPVGFPLVADPTYPYDGSPLVNFRTWVDGREQEVREVDRRRKDRDGKTVGRDEGRDLSWEVTPVFFPAGGKTRVRVRYDAEYQDRWASYFFGTGAAWSGTIGRALFIVKPGPEMSYEKLDVAHAGAKARRVRVGPSSEGLLLEDFKPESGATFDVQGAGSLWRTVGLSRCGYGEGDVVECSDIDYRSWDYVAKPIPASLLERVPLEGLRILRNAFFAGHGRVFRDARLGAVFSRRSWYRPGSGFDLAGLGVVEKRNVAAIAA
ncbi:MAG: YARHG domain-containing protein, partial [Elusimicrobia bacterium]|nr:YARHG domain-containing protein [Elusimicrobiota bacterium]